MGVLARRGDGTRDPARPPRPFGALDDRNQIALVFVGYAHSPGSLAVTADARPTTAPTPTSQSMPSRPAARCGLRVRRSRLVLPTDCRATDEAGGMERGVTGGFFGPPVRGRAGRGAGPPALHHHPGHHDPPTGRPCRHPGRAGPARAHPVPGKLACRTSPAGHRPVEPAIRQIVRRCIRAFARRAHRLVSRSPRWSAAGHRPPRWGWTRPTAGDPGAGRETSVSAKGASRPRSGAKELEAWLKQRITRAASSPPATTLSALVNARIDGARSRR